MRLSVDQRKEIYFLHSEGVPVSEIKSQVGALNGIQVQNSRVTVTTVTRTPNLILTKDATKIGRFNKATCRDSAWRNKKATSNPDRLG